MKKKDWTADDMLEFTEAKTQRMIDTQMGHRDSSKLIEHIESFKPKKVLEVGCGYGRNLLLFNSKIEVTGIDFSPSMLKHAKAFCKGKKNIKLIQANVVEGLDSFKDNSFDVVFTDTVLAHIPDKDIAKVIDEIKRVAKHRVIIKEADKRKRKLFQILFKKWHEIHRNYAPYEFHFVKDADFLEWVKK
ncbi:MAG: class I SAM-dependent methyltransferase [archaeon]|nr:class I SAM-dependent methyltransferase [archaeon]